MLLTRQRPTLTVYVDMPFHIISMSIYTCLDIYLIVCHK